MSREHKWQLPPVMRLSLELRRDMSQYRRDQVEFLRARLEPCECGSRFAQYVCESCGDAICGRCARHAYWLPTRTIMCPGCYALFSEEPAEGES